MSNEIPGLGRRVAALFVDLLMLKLADLPLSRVLREITPSSTAVLALEFGVMLLYSTIFLSRRGQTPGKIMASLRVISVHGGAVTQGQAFVRALVKWAPIFGLLIALASLNPLPLNPQQVALNPESILVQPDQVDADQVMIGNIISYLGLVMLFALVWITRRHPDQQSLHDRVAGTLVMRVP
ncbi:MAG: RDD family protein [bacterium]|nr:RDD family protein [bacterium]